jgi:hypothetical protein
MSNTNKTAVLRQHAEIIFAEELNALASVDDRPRPRNWLLSPWAVSVYLLGGKLDNGFEITPKYYGNRRVIEIAIATLATDRALLLIGVPGTGKSWVSEHLTAAISGDSTLLIRGPLEPARRPFATVGTMPVYLQKGLRPMPWFLAL